LIGSILFFVGITCEYNSNECFISHHSRSFYYIPLIVILSIVGALLLQIALVPFLVKYEQQRKSIISYDIVSYIFLNIQLILYYLHFIGPGVFAFVFYSYNSYGFNADKKSSHYITLSYSDFWFYFAAYLFYCTCGVIIYIYYFGFYEKKS